MSCGWWWLREYQAAARVPADFAFEARWGVGGRNSIDTRDHTYSKDLVEDGVKTINLRLNRSQMARIYDLLMEVDFMNHPGFPPAQGNIYITPSGVSSLSVTMDGKTQYIVLTTEQAIHLNGGLRLDRKANPAVVSFIETINKIDAIVNESPAVKRLPQPRGLYV